MTNRLPGAARIYLWLTACAAAGFLAYWLTVWRGPIRLDPLLLPLFISGVVAQHLAVHIGPRRKVDASIAVYFASLLLTGGPVGVALVGVSQLVGQATLALRRNPQTRRRLRTLRSILFNTSQFMVATALAGLVYFAFVPHQAPAALDRMENAWAVPLAAATLYLANSLAVAGIAGLQRRESLVAVWLAGRRQTAWHFVALLLIGVLTAYASTHDPWSLLVIVLPVGLVYLALHQTVQLTAQMHRLRQSEERYRTLVDMAPEVIFAISAADATLTALNPAFERITGWPGDKWLGRSLFELIHPDDLPLAQSNVAEALRGRQGPSFELRIHSMSGTYLVAEITAVPRIEGGTVTGVFGVARDVTGMKTLALLEERERIAMDLHDGVIQSLFAVTLDLAAQERLATPATGAVEGAGGVESTLQGMRRARGQISDIIRDIRNYIYDLRPQELEGRDLRIGLKNVAEELRVNALVRPRLEVELDVDAEQRLSSETVASLLHITREATSNVIRHAQASEVSIRLDSPDAQHVELTIRDNGRGFDSPGVDDRRSGSLSTAEGRGLHNMAARVELIGGQLSVTSTPGIGTVVRLSVPLRTSVPLPQPGAA
jgi:PAS domain S-box-containing protein